MFLTVNKNIFLEKTLEEHQEVVDSLFTMCQGQLDFQFRTSQQPSKFWCYPYFIEGETEAQ